MTSIDDNDRSSELQEPLLSEHNEISVEAKDSHPNVVLIEGSGGPPPRDGHESFSVRAEIWEMVQLGLPLAVSFFCRMGMASTDSAFVGHIHEGATEPETYLAAAVLSDMVVNVLLVPPLAFNQVLNGLVGQAVGSGNPSMAGVWLQQSMFWLSTTMAPFLVGLWYVEPILLLLGFPEDVSALAGTYAKYNVAWPIPNGLYQCMRFYFQAQGRPRPAMYNNLVFLGVNAMLNWIFVFGGPFRSMFGWKGFGFIGAAISISCSRVLQGLVYFIYMFCIKKYHLSAWPEHGWSFQHHTRERTLEFIKQSVPNIGTLIFQSVTSQVTTVFVGRLGELSIAASSVLSVVTIPWSGTLSATTSTVSGVRVGFHMGRGDGAAARTSSFIVLAFLMGACVMAAVIFLPFGDSILRLGTDDSDVLDLAQKIIPAMLVGTFFNLVAGNITSGVLSGMGRPLIATILSFGLELPLSIGGVAIYILVMHGDLVGVYWLSAITGLLESVIVLVILMLSNWDYWACKAIQRQEARLPSGVESDDSAPKPQHDEETATETTGESD